MTPFNKRTQRRIFEQKITKIAKGLWVGALVLVLPSRARSVAERDRSFAVRFFKRVRSHHFEQKITKIAKGLWVCVLAPVLSRGARSERGGTARFRFSRRI